MSIVTVSRNLRLITSLRGIFSDWEVRLVLEGRRRFFGIAALLVLLSPLVHASEQPDGWVFLPESKHQQYETFAFYIDEQSSLLYRTGGRAWGAVGGSFSLLEAHSWAWKPQLVAIASANAAYRFRNESTGLLTETIDARAGLLVDFEPIEGHRFSVGWTHFSGHISDDVPDRDLIGPNMGWEEFRVRYFYSRPSHYRVGGTLKPIIGSDPTAMAWASDQFVEWYPIGLSPNRRSASPYIAGGLEEYGANRVQLTGQVQAGVLFGNHDLPLHIPSVRFAIGYYNGVDPRLKYAAFKFTREQFGFGGIFVDL